MWIAEREQVATTYTPDNGSFGYVTSTNAEGVVTISNWENCRELFLTAQAGNRVWYFKHNLPVGRGRSIAEFIEKIEKKLGIKSIRRTKIQATSKRKIIKVNCAPFWDQSHVRRSLFTALLRASQSYRMTANGRKGNLEQALYSVAYTINTRRAVERFINQRAVHYWAPTGNTQQGWQTIFSNKTNAQIGRMLKKVRKLKHPKPKVKIVTVMGQATPVENPPVAA
jgi:hypothetical protein